MGVIEVPTSGKHCACAVHWWFSHKYSASLCQTFDADSKYHDSANECPFWSLTDSCLPIGVGSLNKVRKPFTTAIVWPQPISAESCQGSCRLNSLILTLLGFPPKKHQLWKVKAGRVASHGFRHAEFNDARENRFQARLGFAHLI